MSLLTRNQNALWNRSTFAVKMIIDEVVSKIDILTFGKSARASVYGSLAMAQP